MSVRLVELIILEETMILVETFRLEEPVYVHIRVVVLDEIQSESNL